jgi:signal transduction histidine kinase
MDPDKWEQVVIYPLKTKDSEAGGVIVRICDITESMQMQQQLIQTEKLAGMGELAAGVAHEINNPIMGIINYAQILVDEAEERDRETEIPNRIIKEGERIEYIVKSLLAFGRDDHGERVSVSIRAIVTDTIELLNHQLKKDQIKIRQKIPNDIPPVWVNAHKIKQTIFNLLSNARYALNKKYPGAHKNKFIEVNSQAVEADGVKMVRTAVYDRGFGIPKSDLDRIFDPFFTTKPQGEGTGLGLSISKSIIEECNGKIQIESAEGEYTRATLDLPMSEEQAFGG